MPIALTRHAVVADTKATASTWMQLLWLTTAGIFVSLIAMTYGLDLSPGFF